MSNVTHLHGLTTTHRFLMSRIQDICVDISLYTPDAATCVYSGVDHSISVRIVPQRHLASADGGDGSYKSEWSQNVYLPPSELADANSFEALSQLLNQLAARLPMPGPGPGGAA